VKKKESIPSKASQEVVDAIHAVEDWELLEPYGSPYPTGSPAKVEWLRERQSRFGEHLVPIPIGLSKAQKKIAKRRRRRDNLRTADEMDRVLFNVLDNPATIPRPIEIKGQAATERQIITKLHIPE
jgi:hypothetical protein